MKPHANPDSTLHQAESFITEIPMAYQENGTRRPPIFILSCERSGSTLLRCLVDTHPKICSPAQLYLGALCDGLFTAAFYSIGQLPDTISEEKKERIAIAEVRRTVGHLMERYAQGKGKPLWCEKSTSNLDHLPILGRVFPEARYICLYRNCMDVAHSSIKFNPLGFMSELAPYVGRNPENFVAAMTESWLDKNRKLLDFEAGNSSHCFRITYESLVTNPALILPSMFDFLGVEWDEGLMESAFKVPHDRGEGDLKVWLSESISRDSVGRGSSIPSTLIPENLLPRVEALHRELGYPSLEAYYASPHPAPRPIPSKGDAAPGISRFLHRELAEILKRRRDEFNTLRGICKFIVHGAEGGVWTIDLSGPEPRIEAGRESKSNCTIALSCAVLGRLLNGEKTAVEAYEQGEIVADGDLGLAIQFGRLLLG
jgi:protein-tyrosine sulfotransferase